MTPPFKAQRDSNAQPPADSHPTDSHPADNKIDQALARLNQVQPPSHFQHRLSARIARELHSPAPVPFYQRIRWQSASLVAAGLAAAFIGGVFARPLLHHNTPAFGQPVATHPAARPPTLAPSAQPAFNVRMADGHTAAMSPAGVVASSRSRAEHTRTQLASHGEPQDTNLGRLANKPPRPGQLTPGENNSGQTTPGQTTATPAHGAAAPAATAQSAPATPPPQR